ncbi:polyphosphate kinase 1 [Bacilliculturomica massiliensis]|uniref:polyphosphate kinase 1 n=1 Tax=Bacilliculturomica massiliensis TaxID=1917867 RepID=UPI0010324F3A|nr:polyphosphate kinase 1 [Bacilliculturomica massiliensis]
MKRYADISYTQNRELSWLRFNQRVLQEAEDETVPIFERLKFAAIFVNNLDEFFMIRVGSLFDLSMMKEPHIDNKSGMDPGQQLEKIFKAVSPLYRELDETFDAIEEQLMEYGVSRIKMDQLGKKERAYVREYWETYIFPILSPQIVDPHRPFPHLQNKTLNIVVKLKDELGICYGIVPVPASLPRMLFMPGNSVRYVLVEDIICDCAEEIFHMYQLLCKSVTIVTRNADISPEDEGFEIDDDYRARMKKMLRKRKRLAAVRLEIQGKVTEDTLDFLLGRLKISASQVFYSTTPLNLSYVFELEGKIPTVFRKNITYIPFEPQPSAVVKKGESILSQSLRRDILLFYPYEQMEPFLQMIREAAGDPAVISIKITIYRLASKAKLVEYLSAAAENGKDVTILMELRARFDEASNINWSNVLEEAGCNVIYGFEGFKTHSKICMVTRREKSGIRYITQVGTGNYNEKTAKMYTDLCLITSDREIGEDASLFFQNMGISNLDGKYRRLLAAPNEMKPKLIAMIDEEIDRVKNRMQGRIWLKINSLTDRDLIDKLEEASCAGVKIDMIVRGICCILPGIPGKTENITVRSIVGRYLEHSRIYCFGPAGEERIFISSADFMTRNTERRIEIACPVLDEGVKQRILEMMNVMFRDNVKAREMQPDGTYIRRSGSDRSVLDSQEYFMEEAARKAGKSEEGPQACRHPSGLGGMLQRLMARWGKW